MQNPITGNIPSFFNLTGAEPAILNASTPTKRPRETEVENEVACKKFKTAHLKGPQPSQTNIQTLSIDLLGYISRFFDNKTALAFYSTCTEFFISRFHPQTPLKCLQFKSCQEIDQFIHYCQSLSPAGSILSCRQREDFWGIRALHLKVESELSLQKIKTLIALLPQLRSVHIQLDTRKSNTPLNSLLQPLKKLPGLTEFNLSSVYHDNGIKNLPDVLWEFKALQKLTLKNFGCMVALPAEIGELQNLQALKLINVKLTVLPEEIWTLSKLRTLFIQGTDIQALSPSIGQLKQLRHLTLSHLGQQLNALPAQIGELSELQELVLQTLPIFSLPAAIWGLSKLQTLKLIGLRTEALPAEIGQLSQLRNLMLSSLRLDALPVEVGSLQLNRLKLNMLNIRTLPPMESFVALKKLTLNFLRHLSTVAGIEKLPQLRRLTLYELPQIDTISTLIKAQPPGLESLSISDCPKLNIARSDFQKVKKFSSGKRHHRIEFVNK